MLLSRGIPYYPPAMSGQIQQRSPASSKSQIIEEIMSSQDIEQTGESRTITFHHIKSNLFRVIHADGVWGGVTPNLNIQMAFYSERNAIPQSVKQEFGEYGLPGEIIDTVGKEGIVREFDTSVVVNLEVAKAFHDWLGKKIAQAENIVEKAKASDKAVSKQ